MEQNGISTEEYKINLMAIVYVHSHDYSDDFNSYITYAQTYQAVYITYVQFILCQLYLNKSY